MGVRGRPLVFLGGAQGGCIDRSQAPAWARCAGGTSAAALRVHPQQQCAAYILFRLYGESLSLACPRESNQRERHPESGSRCAGLPALRHAGGGRSHRPSLACDHSRGSLPLAPRQRTSTWPSYGTAKAALGYRVGSVGLVLNVTAKVWPGLANTSATPVVCKQRT